MTTNEAIHELRRSAGESQQVFSTRLSLSISALQKHETRTKPDPKQLLIYQREAERVKRDDLADVFRSELIKALPSPGSRVSSSPPTALRRWR